MKHPVIINNNASRNKRHKVQHRDIKNFSKPEYQLCLTENPADMKLKIREILQAKPEVILVKGGDGTMHHVLNALGEKYGTTVRQWPIILVPIPAGATNAIAGCVVRPGAFGRLVFRLLSGSRDQIGDVFELPLLRMQMKNSRGKPQEILATSVHVAGLFNRFYQLFFSRQGSALHNVAKALRLAFKQVKAKPGRDYNANEDALFEPFPAAVVQDKNRLPHQHYSILNVSSIMVRIYFYLRFFVQVPAGQMRLVAGLVRPIEIFSNLPRVLTARLMKGRNAREIDARTIVVSATGDERLSPVVDGEIYKDIREIKFTLGPSVRLMSYPRFCETYLTTRP